MRDLYVFPGVGQQARLRITTEHLDRVAVTASHQNKQPIGSDREIPRMDACVLIADVCQ